MIKEICHNPFRLLGILTNSSIKLQTANITKMKAYLRVNKPVSYPFDLTRILGVPNRTLDTITQAESYLTNENDKLKFAQFWFVSGSSSDDIIFSKLNGGDIDIALLYWSRYKTVSSQHNCIVAYILKGNYKLATNKAISFYREHATDFAKLIGLHITINSQVLVNNYFRMLDANGIDIIDLDLDDYPEEYHIAIESIFEKPIIDEIEKKVAWAKAKRAEGIDASFEAGKSLMSYSEEYLSKLRHYIQNSMISFNIVSDKVANEILECAIEFHNGSSEWNKASKSLFLYEYAKSIAQGEAVKKRAEENLSTISGNILLEKNPIENYCVIDDDDDEDENEEFDMESFVTINGFKLGQTTWNDLESEGYNINDCGTYKYLTLSDCSYWDFKLLTFIPEFIVYPGSGIPTCWSKMGFKQWFSYDDVIEFFEDNGGEVTIIKEPETIVNDDDEYVFKAQVRIDFDKEEYYILIYFDSVVTTDVLNGMDNDTMSSIHVYYTGTQEKPVNDKHEYYTSVYGKSRSSKKIFNSRCRVVSSPYGFYMWIKGKGYTYLTSNPISDYQIGSIWIKSARGADNYMEIVYAPRISEIYTIGYIKLINGYIEFKDRYDIIDRFEIV